MKNCWIGVKQQSLTQSGTNCLLHRLCRKNNNLTAKKTKRFNLNQNTRQKSYGSHFGIIIKSKKFSISSFKWKWKTNISVGLSYHRTSGLSDYSYAPFLKGLSLLWSYGSWIYNYLCNQCLSPLMLWVPIPLMLRCNWYNIMW